MLNRRTKIMILSVLSIAFLALAGAAFAQEADAENCKDHPMFSRMKNYIISDCKTSFDAVEFYMPGSQTKTVEGQVTRINYSLREGAPMPSVLQVRRNYGNAVKSLSGSVLFDEEIYLTAKVVKNGKEIWVKLDVYNDGRDFTLNVLEVEAMVQEVTADAMYDALTKDGFMALYINFDTGKSAIKPESMPIVEQIAALMKAHTDLKLSIEGHTDNVGTAASNKTLSEQRAKAVLDAVVKQGIAANRMTAIGWGQDKPVADNRTEEGKAKNRRVEIVKK
ncbi:MAG: OmpA family protein [Candidatus Aminicenantes bacterium]|nr:OmpA family protein [Candidatus Aminicenantes bacterium]